LQQLSPSGLDRTLRTIQRGRNKNGIETQPHTEQVKGCHANHLTMDGSWNQPAKIGIAANLCHSAYRRRGGDIL